MVAWNRLAEQCNQFLAKGRLVYAEGRIHTRNWEGQDGQSRSKIEVIANRVIFLDRRGAAVLSDERSDERSDDSAVLPDDKTGDSSVAEMEPEDLPF